MRRPGAARMSVIQDSGNHSVVTSLPEVSVLFGDPTHAAETTATSTTARAISATPPR